MRYRAAVITCSDRAFADLYEDRSGPILSAGLESAGFETGAAVIVPDEAKLIHQAVCRVISAGARVVLTTGGTGIGPRDVTVEAIRRLIAYEIPGIAEAIRTTGIVKTPLAALSRGIAGVIEGQGQRAFIFTAPGSRGGARDCLQVLLPLLTHIVEQLDGADHDLTRPASL